MLIIRLTRRGKKNDPSFKIVVTEASNPIRGKFLEELGYYIPKLKEKSFDKERILHWIKQGAKCSPTIHNLLVSEGIIQGQKVKAWRPKKKEGSAQEKEVSDAPEKSEEETKKVSESQADEKPEVVDNKKGLKTEESKPETVKQKEEKPEGSSEIKQEEKKEENNKES
ncbi:MAG: 30S ribosomal protein S16 [Candidatus Portnoybacteria bacterium]|nr:30S ribosomal protein S16 [Candidatus Portnoybacteria bacterium]